MSLTNKRRVFVYEYLKCWNATEAARRAEYKHPGSQGHDLLKIPEIDAYIQAIMAEKAMSANEVLARLTEVACVDISEFIDDVGRLDWDKVRAKGFLIRKIRYNADKNSEIELHDQMRALELLGKYHKLFTERHEVEATHTVSDDVLDAITGSIKRGYESDDEDEVE